jgi:SAM-dependent methyltransferase
MRSVLDLGCGTGGHALPLLVRGYEVTGVDRAPAMLERARSKAEAAGLAARASFVEGDLRSVRLPGAYDAVLAMFAVLSYQADDTSFAGALETARAHLAPDGVLVFDVWYAPAVLAQRPERRTKTIATGDGELRRTAWADLDEARSLCTVHIEVEGELVERTREDHVMRCFTRAELERFLGEAGLELLRLGGFPELEREPGADTWSVLAVAKPQ